MRKPNKNISHSFVQTVVSNLHLDHVHIISGVLVHMATLAMEDGQNKIYDSIWYLSHESKRVLFMMLKVNLIHFNLLSKGGHKNRKVTLW